ncbi:MAG: DegT/DnrJ/EryC1/StrS family aminotransferase [Planctomycetes bacterium]|nr:DegT/DnrJ/EryC1/StrS family aminotransferase [Planctomycetota bacterium]
MKLTSPKFDQDEVDFVSKCLESGWVTQGPMVQEFEKRIAQRQQVAHALATTSCTAALHLGALSLGLKPGDEVIVPAFTWITSAHAVEYVGAKAVFADVDPITFNLDPVAFEAAITPNTRAVVVVHLFGLAAPMDEIMAIAKKYSLLVIEDAACAIGTRYDGKPVGGIGDVGCFSFHPRKVITTGEGGALTTNRDELPPVVNAYRCHGFSGYPTNDSGQTHPYTMGSFDYLGFNLRLSDIQAAVGLAQLNKLDGLLAERCAAANSYSSLLAEIEEVAIPTVPAKCGHTYQSYVIRIQKGGVARRNLIMDEFQRQGIQTRPGTHAVHRLGYYAKKYGIDEAEFPNACDCEDTTITLPIFPGITIEDQMQVVACLKSSI